MQTGTKISLAGHGVLMGWAVFGGWFSAAPEAVQVQEVSVISAADFERLSQRPAAPAIAPEPAALSEPEQPAEVPQLSATAETQVETSQPETVQTPAVEVPPETVPTPDPAPEVAPQSPEVLDAPETSSIIAALPEPEQLRPAERVAPEPVAAPEPEVAIDDIVQPEVSTDVGAEAEQEAQEETAEEAASDRIVTEANEDEEAELEPAPVVSAPSSSLRPQVRPRRPQAPEQPTEVTEPLDDAESETQDQASAIEDALAAAIAGGGEVEAPEPSGPPLTSGEKDALRVAVSKCWNVGSLSSDALRTTVEVSVTLSQDGKPDPGSIRMISSTGGSNSAAKQAYEAARRAIIRCGARGFQLPQEKYSQWREVVMTFNPEKMRIK